MKKVLENKNAVINSGGSIAVARGLAREGARVFLAGRTRDLQEMVANGSPMMGSTGPADAATDALIRNPAAEVGPQGLRVLGIWNAGLPEKFLREKLATVDSGSQEDAASQGLIESLDQMRMTRRSPRPRKVAATAAFLASQEAAAITGTFVNTISGTFPS